MRRNAFVLTAATSLISSLDTAGAPVPNVQAMTQKKLSQASLDYLNGPAA